MDYIFIDTSIWISENFLEGNKIKQLLAWGKSGTVKILLPLITKREILNKAKQFITLAANKQKQLQKDELRIVRNLPEMIEKLKSLSDKQNLTKRIHAELEFSLTQAHCLEIDYPVVSLKETFEKYFDGRFPFSVAEKKKHEFPDAFALLSIEEWAKTNKQKVRLFSTDADLLNYESKLLIVEASIEEYLDRKIRDLESGKKRRERLKKIESLFEFRRTQFESQVEGWLENELNEDKLYHEYFGLEVYDIKITHTAVTIPDFKISNIREDQINLESVAEVSYEVEVVIDDQYTRYYDEDAEDVRYYSQKVETIERSEAIPLKFKVDLPLKKMNEEFLEVILEEINNGQGIDL